MNVFDNSFSILIPNLYFLSKSKVCEFSMSIWIKYTSPSSNQILKQVMHSERKWRHDWQIRQMKINKLYFFLLSKTQKTSWCVGVIQRAGRLYFFSKYNFFPKIKLRLTHSMKWILNKQSYIFFTFFSKKQWVQKAHHYFFCEVFIEHWWYVNNNDVVSPIPFLVSSWKIMQKQSLLCNEQKT